MSGWPWMTGVEEAIADPIIEEDDCCSNKHRGKRPSVNLLIREHGNLIDQLRVKLSSHECYDPQKHDDLWLLRFLLSHKMHVKRAHRAAVTTLEYRHRFQLDDLDRRFVPPQFVLPEFRDAANHYSIPDNFPLWESVQRFWNGGLAHDSVNLQVPHDTNVKGRVDEQGHVQLHQQTTYGTVFFFNIAGLDTHKLATVTDEDWLASVAFFNEFSFQWIDYITRTTGRLTKAVHIVDVQGITWKLYDMQTQNKYTKAASQLQDCYPQAVQAYLVCHAPSWIQVPWKVLKPLLPRRVVTKLDFIHPTKYAKDKERLLEFLPNDLLPTRFGGALQTWPPHWDLPYTKECL